MVLMTAAAPGCIRWRNSLAETGMDVVGIEFRNGGGRLGNHPFPAGLNACAAGVRWVYQTRAALGITGLVVSGESGGGNLSIATALKALQEGWINELKGLPPHAISVNELDPLRDEGLAFYRKLLAAGVSATARTINGTTHAAAQVMADVIPEVFRASIEAVSGFVKSVASSE